ncbi:MAG: 5'-nucleotidase C-terminal domain-containing protein, partial [Solobacterium sp.]|nr:5'-nucleotidase C-terminal domain-containing protein [Solobacterium sp.]
MSETNNKTHLTLLVTSDLHGHLYPYNYMESKETKTGSLAQIAVAIKKLYDPGHTILADCGDTVQDNFADLFLEDEIHPMMEGLNDIGYEIWTTGNHEYDFGTDILKRVISQFKGHALLGNVFDENGNRIAEPYVILNRAGVRVAVLSMVTPNIKEWDETLLMGYTVTNPIDETRKLLKELEGKYDVLIGIHHMGFKDEFNVEGSGVVSYLKYFPEFDVVMAAHEHVLREGQLINGVLTAENMGSARSMFKITLDLEKSGEKWKVTDKRAEAVMMQDFDPDPAFLEKYKGAHERALEKTRRVIGIIEGDTPLAGVNPVESYASADFEPKPLITLLNRVLQYYAGVKVSCTALSKYRTNLQPGEVTISDAAWLFPYPNTINKIKMTGRQLRKFIEYNAKYYQAFREGDLTLTINPEWAIYQHMFFSGVNFEINISKEPGHRIEKLTWPDGTPLKDEDEFPFAATSFCYATFLDSYGPVFSEEDGLPEMIEEGVRPDLSYYPNMIIDYIEHVLKGNAAVENENNWKITGWSWDEALHQKALDYLANGWIPESIITEPKKHDIYPIRL